MRLYHGTAAYNEEPILKKRLRKFPHKGIMCACCSLSLKEAGFFALRRTPMADLTKTGVVIEFEGELAKTDYMEVPSYGLLRDEMEIAVLDTEKLEPVAVWRFEKGWARYSIKETCL